MKASNFYQTKNTPFAIIETEEGDFRIVIGDQLATRKSFKTKEKALTFLSKTDWDIITTLIHTIVINQVQRIFQEADTKEENNMQND